MKYSVLIGRGSNIARSYKIRNLPRLFIINKEGYIDTEERFLLYDDIKEVVDILTQPSEKTDDKNH